MTKLPHCWKSCDTVCFVTEMFVTLVICAAWTALCGSAFIPGSGPVIGNQNEAIPGIVGQ